MGIANYKPDARLPLQSNLPKVEPKAYKSTINIDRDTPIKSLMAFMEGAPWPVTYYSQIVSEHNDIREIDPNSPSVYQQYSRIVGIDIHVSSALADSYDSTTGISTVTGNGLLPGLVIPNKGDHFVTDSGTSKTGIFRVTSVERKTFNKESAFYIEYEIIGYTDTLVDLYKSLEDKTVKTYYFSKDRLLDGLQPLVKEEDYKQVSDLKFEYREIINYYFNTFFNRKYMTLVLPGQEYSIYDSFLVNYLMKIIDTFDNEHIREMRIIPTDNEPYMDQDQFWSVMFRRNYHDLESCNKTMGLLLKQAFHRNTFGKGASFSNVDYLVYPVTGDTTSLIHDMPSLKMMALNDLIETKNHRGELASLIDMTYIESAVTYKLIHPVLSDPLYVLSSNFYENTQFQSVLEILTKDYLKQNQLSLKRLYSLINSYKSWSRLEQYYYGPILITLIKEADRGIYT